MNAQGEKISALQREALHCKGCHEDMQKYLRRNTIEISGVPISPTEDIYALVKEIGREAGCLIGDEDIDIAHRIPTRIPGRTPSIVVRFVRRQKKIELLIKKPRLTSAFLNIQGRVSNIYIGHHLTKKQKELLAKAKERRSDLGGEEPGFLAYTAYGRVFLRKATDQRGTELVSLAQLDELLPPA